MKGKKLLSILLASAMLSGALAGCGGSDAPAAPESQQKEEQTDTAKEEAGRSAGRDSCGIRQRAAVP